MASNLGCTKRRSLGKSLGDTPMEEPGQDNETGEKQAKKIPAKGIEIKLRERAH